MSIAIIRFLFDFGLFVLIWIIQRIIYPSFLYYKKENLVTWHKEYTSRFSMIVIPLMLAQLGVSIYQLTISLNLYTLVSVAIIIFVWIATFLQFVPIHAAISNGNVSEKMLHDLVHKNWIRTILWTLLFLISLYCLDTVN
ncbi:MAG: hypothetical protein ACI849_000847 [Patiriisocius sp.]|jgi:hypothetical protein